MAAEVATFGAKYGRVPHLVVILVGEDPGSVSYVTGKAKASAEVGIRNTTIRKPESVSEAELLGIIADLNADEGVDGILVQLPLPKLYRRGQGDRRDRQGEGCRRLPSLNVAALWQKQPCTLPLYAERYPQDAAGCGRGDRRQGGRGDRPQQYRRGFPFRNCCWMPMPP